MCTLTTVLLPGENSLRVAFNRDELRTRALAQPPGRLRFGPRAAVAPIDPDGGGTWIGVNDAGVLAATLNLNPPHTYFAQGKVSRGTLVPTVLAQSTIDDAIASSTRLPLSDFSPFRLALFQRQLHALVVWDGHVLQIERHAFAPDRMLLTSSGLGDSVVAGQRSELFHSMGFAAPNARESQDRFHAHSWPDRPEVSVCMRRRDALTVSLTVIELRPQQAHVRYQPGPPDVAGDAHVSTLALTPG